MPNLIKHLTKNQQEEFFDALNYMNMQEIKAFCLKHDISMNGKKGNILDRIKHYLTTGCILQPKKIPPKSKADKNKNYPLAPKTLILHGAYKNDLKTRIFLKSIIGEHFHFTAFGQDWIMNRWQQGKPPTYSEFAKFWQKEYLKRKNSKANPRKEWAYLNFIQRTLIQSPKISKKELTSSWEKERSQQAKKAIMILNQISNSID